MKVIFIKGAAPIGLAYSEGNEAEFTDAYANELIERGYCQPIEEVKQAVEQKPEAIETATEEKHEEVTESVVEKPEEVKQAVSKKKSK